jgi:predicted RNase H-like nuclease (RuvC/YqgF family)
LRTRQWGPRTPLVPTAESRRLAPRPIQPWNRPGRHVTFSIMDTETSTAITALADTMNRCFELQQAQFMEWRDEVRGEFAGLRREFSDLRDRVDALTDRVSRLENEVVLLRDFVTREVAGIRLELRELRAQADQTDELRREIADVTARVDRLEQRHTD